MNQVGESFGCGVALAPAAAERGAFGAMLISAV